MLVDIAYYSIFGRPLIMYVGVLTLSFLFLTATISALNRRGIRVIPFKWHPRMAKITLILAAIHGTLGLSIYL